MARLRPLQPIEKIDILDRFDYENFKKGRENANWLTDWYMRNPASGTYYKRIPDNPANDAQALRWERQFDQWRLDGLPDQTYTYENTEYKILWDDENYPIFHHNHGWRFLPWQLQAYHAPQDEHTIIGGFGSGKTAYIAACLACWAMTVPNFRGFAVAPQMLQTMEVYKYINTNFANTPWMTRFVKRNVTKPWPTIELKSNFIGVSTIELLSIESDPDKVRTLEGDTIFLDQAEKIQDLDDLVLNIGSRLRGSVFGRNRIGRLTLVANAGDNPELWQRYDMEQHEPRVYKSFNPHSEHNTALSDRDLANLRRRVGGSQQDVDQWMHGTRPLGKGEIFSGNVINLALDKSLDETMASIIAQQSPETTIEDDILHPIVRPDGPIGDYICKSTTETGIHHWEMPPDFAGGGQYIVVGDPGQGNPPHRNSPVIMVWDVKDFPIKPAKLRVFRWVWGNGSYEPFLALYTDYVRRYRAQGRNGFDSTGTQKGFDELYFANYKIFPTGMNMAGSGKYHAINSAVFLLSKGLIKFPYISHMTHQMSTYVLPDTKIRQDIVSCFIMSCQLMQQFFYIDIPDSEDENIFEPEPYERSSRLARSRSSIGRSSRF